MHGSFKQIDHTQTKSLTKMWRIKTDLLDFQHRHKYKQTMKDKEGLHSDATDGQPCSVSPLTPVVLCLRSDGNSWREDLQKRSIFVVIYDRNIPEQ